MLEKISYIPNILEISPDDIFNIEEVENYLDPNVLNKSLLGKIKRKFYKINRKVQNELNNTSNIELTGERFPEQKNKLPDVDMDFPSLGS